jgi:LPXTG-motif cell wall-anchored protein
LAALDTTNKNAEVYEKNDEPQITKEVRVAKEDAPWLKNVDVDFEDYVEFKTEITLQQGMDNYKLKDVMEDGLTLVKSTDEDYATHPTTVKFSRTTGDIDVYVPANVEALDKAKVTQLDGASNPSQNVTTKNWELKTTSIDTGCDFEIHFSNANKDKDDTPTWPAGQPNVVTILGMDKAPVASSTEFKFYDVKDGDKLTITYWAKLSNAEKTKIDVMNSTTHPSTANKSDIQNASSEDIGTDVIDISADPMNVLYENDGDGRNENYTILVYGAKSYTRWEKASVTTYKFDVVKTKDSKPADTTLYELLTGAKFKVYKVHESVTEVTPPAIADTVDRTIGAKKYTIDSQVLFTNKGETTADGKTVVDGTYYYAGDSATVAGGATEELTSNDEQAMSIIGIEGGIYMIEETYAPTGYDQLSHPIIIEVTARSAEYNARTHINKDYTKNTGTPAADDAFTNEGTITNIIRNNVGAELANQANVLANAKITAIDEKASNTYDSGAEGQGGVLVINRTTSELPSTGGMGTTVLYIVGGMLVILAGAYLFFSRKRTA